MEPSASSAGPVVGKDFSKKEKPAMGSSGTSLQTASSRGVALGQGGSFQARAEAYEDEALGVWEKAYMCANIER